MKVLLLLSLVVALAGDTAAQTQTPPAAQPKPTQKPPPAPAQPRAQTPRRAPQPAARSGIAITVTTPTGATIAGVTVDVTGPTARNGTTDGSGQVNFPGLQAGTYRVRFSGDAVIAFEREVIVRAGQIADLDVVLNAAPPREQPAAAAAPPPPAPAAAASPVGPAGQPQIVSIVDLVERELIAGSAARKDTLVSCSGNTRTMLLQLNQPQATRVYEDAESSYYVVAGEGSVTVRDKEVPLEAGRYISLPRGTPHSLTRRGRRPLILLSMLSGEPCEEAK